MPDPNSGQKAIPLRLNQVLLNILGNAMKYTGPGGTVSVRIIQSDDVPEGYASYQFRVREDTDGVKHLEKLAGLRALMVDDDRVPIVAMTANAFDEDRQRAFDADMDGHVPKPLDIPMLMENLRMILERDG